jgi:hypothetical protein
MTAPDQPNLPTEDQGFKALFSTYPVETIETFVPEIIAERGRPVSVTVLVQHEIPLPNLGEPSRFLDVALRATFADGSEIVLIEHWSRVRAIHRRRVNYYVAALALQFPEATVIPVLLVTDPTEIEIPDLWTMGTSWMEVATLRMRVIRITEDQIPRLRALRNRVAAALLALAYRNAVDAAVNALVAFDAAPGSLDDLRRFLPLIETLAKLQPDDAPEYRRRLKQEPRMSIVETWVAEAEAKGELTAILHMVAKGRATVDAARAEIADLVAAGTITRAQADAALAKLG